MSIGYIKSCDLESTVFLGELSLNGNINKIKGVLPICIEARKQGIKRVILPKSNCNEATLVSGLEIIGVDRLEEVIAYLNKKMKILPEKHKEEKTEIKYEEDVSDIKGQFFAKRALEIAAAGGHNCLLIGTPGSGKTMMAKRFQTILPDLSFDEKIDVTKIYSVSGLLDNDLISQRPFRSPHHSITKTGLIGGGTIPKPGEISLAHLGVLYLDELLEFKTEILEQLRIPLEEKSICIDRAKMSVNYPCDFILIASTNPCPCGYYGSSIKKCNCSDTKRKNYISRLSGPLKDRFDMQIYVTPVEHKDLKSKNYEKSETIRNRVVVARKIQEERYKNEKIKLNSELTPKLIEKYCKLDRESLEILNEVYTKLSLSTRAYYKIIKLARTIADLECCQEINQYHIMEAIHCRSKDKDEL